MNQERVQALNAHFPFPLTPWRVTLLRIGCSLLIGLALALVVTQLLGEEFGTRKVAKAVAPVEGYFYQPDIRADEITVLLLDDEALRVDKEPWPPSYHYFADILGSLLNLERKPRALFIDVIFTPGRQDATIGELQKAICLLQKSGTQVYLAAATDAGGWPRINQGLVECATPVAVEYRPDDVDKVAWEYPLFAADAGKQDLGPDKDHKQNEETEPRKKPPRLRSAALEIAISTYDRPFEYAKVPLSLTWGLRPASDGLLWGIPASGNAMDAYCERQAEGIRLVLFAIRHALMHAYEEPVCVFHRTIYARQLQWPSVKELKTLEDGLGGKVVMLGTSFEGINDIVVSPIHDRIPGVYAHAMALDNLLAEKGPGYRHRIELGKHFRIDVFNRTFSVLLGGILFVAILRILKDQLALFAHGRTLHRWLRSLNEIVFLGALRWPGPPRSWGLRKALEAVFWIVLKGLEFAASLVVIGLLLWVARAGGVGLLGVVDVVLFALVSEWLEWNDSLVEWLTGSEPTGDFHVQE